MLNRVKELLMENSLCVLCTASGDLPYCSLMTYVLGDDLKTVYMVTIRESRKYRNLMENSEVSLLVDNRQRLAFDSDQQIVSITFEGVLKPLDPVEERWARARLVEKHMELNKILNSHDCVIVGIELKTFLLLNGPVDSVQGNL